MMKNRIINGAMMIDQRNAGASVSITNTGGDTYTLDRWSAYGSQASKFTIQQNAGSVTPPAGYTKYLGATVGASANVTVGSSDNFRIGYYIEGNNIADFSWGTASASTITISFWVRSSVTGTYGGALSNSAYNRGYPFTYTISSANTWEQKTITIAGDTTGTWLTDNGLGLRVYFGLGVGSSGSGTAGSWAASGYGSATGATNWITTNSATFYITGVQLEKGSTATSFDYREYGEELRKCQRYYQKLGNTSYAAVGIGRIASTRGFTASFIRLNQNMRTAPTASFSNLIVTDRENYDQDISAIGSANTSMDSIYVSFNHAAAGTAGQPSVVAVKNGTSGYIDFSAEL